jgi:hypothetical protein
MARLLHTSDWLLGATPLGCPPQLASRLRDRRAEAVRRLASLAETHEVDGVVVCGNILADLTVSDETLAQLVRVVTAFTMPVLLVPGERDPAATFGAWSRLQRPEGATWRVLTEITRVDLAGATVLAVPRSQRASVDDLTVGLDVAGTLVATHAGARGGPHADDAVHRIDVRSLRDAGATVLLGGRTEAAEHEGAHWPGTPEPMVAGRTGSACLVTDDGTTPLDVPSTRWLHARQPVDAAVAWLDEVEGPEDAIVELTLVGDASPSEVVALETRLERRAPRFLHLGWAVDDLRLVTGEDPLPEAMNATRTALLTDGSREARDAALLLARLRGAP